MKDWGAWEFWGLMLETNFTLSDSLEFLWPPLEVGVGLGMAEGFAL